MPAPRAQPHDLAAGQRHAPPIRVDHERPAVVDLDRAPRDAARWRLDGHLGARASRRRRGSAPAASVPASSATSSASSSSRSARAAPTRSIGRPGQVGQRGGAVGDLGRHLGATPVDVDPDPTTAEVTRSPSMVVSSSRPPTFAPSSETRSFGHFRSTGAVRRAGGSRAARAGRDGELPGDAGRQTAAATATLSVRFRPGGDCHDRPRRPRPAVCSSATTARPSPSGSSQQRAGTVVRRADRGVRLHAAADPSPWPIGAAPVGIGQHMRHTIPPPTRAAAERAVHSRVGMSQTLDVARRRAPSGARARLQRHPALRRLAPRQLPWRAGQLRRAPGPVRHDLRHRRLPRPDHRPRRRGAARPDARDGARPAGRRARPCALRAHPAVGLPRARRAGLDLQHLSCRSAGRSARRPTRRSAQQGVENSLGLLDYPVLQAADIVIYKASRVPVGKDQAAHLELQPRDRARLQPALRRRSSPSRSRSSPMRRSCIGTDGATQDGQERQQHHPDLRRARRDPAAGDEHGHRPAAHQAHRSGPPGDLQRLPAAPVLRRATTCRSRTASAPRAPAASTPSSCSPSASSSSSGRCGRSATGWRRIPPSSRRRWRPAPRRCARSWTRPWPRCVARWASVRGRAA